MRISSFAGEKVNRNTRRECRQNGSPYVWVVDRSRARDRAFRVQPSSTSLTFSASTLSENGLAMNLTPSSSTPRCAITSAV